LPTAVSIVMRALAAGKPPASANRAMPVNGRWAALTLATAISMA
jgi:hypothetical protein